MFRYDWPQIVFGDNRLLFLSLTVLSIYLYNNDNNGYF